tara:strand:- start:3056 stop:3541 length:486 start_codon:yes stop_codon:yes gene_type:complete
MNPFEYAWSLLKADQQQQLVRPRTVETRGPNWVETSSRFMPEGTLHPAITGMMERHGIKQPNIMQYQRGTYAPHDTVNPVERMPQYYDLRGRLRPEHPLEAPTHTGPVFHGAKESYFGEPGATEPGIISALDPSVRGAQPIPLEALQGMGTPQLPQMMGGQ